MKTSKQPKTIIKSKSSSQEDIAEYLSILIPQQFEIGAKAIQNNEKDLAHLMACQVFDAIDWSRVNMDSSAMAVLEDKVLSNPVNAQFKFKGLSQLEEYAEKHFS